MAMDHGQSGEGLWGEKPAVLKHRGETDDQSDEMIG